ncbi:hypothetical protein HA402_002463 [Bradysia odoriphaga]|nr:hypothetical protein HA402_002463 [Bradysia odoriphaga]
MGNFKWIFYCGLLLLAISFKDIRVRAEVPSETECRPYIEKALHELKGSDADDVDSGEVDTPDTGPNVVENGDDSDESNEVVQNANDDNDDSNEANTEENDDDDSNETENEPAGDVAIDDESDEAAVDDSKEDDQSEEKADDSSETDGNADESNEDNASEENSKADDDNSNEDSGAQTDGSDEDEQKDQVTNDDKTDSNNSDETEENTDEVTEQQIEAESAEDTESARAKRSVESTEDDNDSKENSQEDATDEENSKEADGSSEKDDENKSDEDGSDESKDKDDTAEDNDDSKEDKAASSDEDKGESSEDQKDSDEVVAASDNKDDSAQSEEDAAEQKPESDEDSKEEGKENESTETEDQKDEAKSGGSKTDADSSEENDTTEEKTTESFPEDDLLMEFEIPTNLRDRSHISELLHLDDESEEREKAVGKVSDVILKDLKRIYETAIKPLETLYKYRDLSNRHFSDPEIFSKPLVLFMGPWSGGKSTILNYLTDNEYTPFSVRTGAEPSPAYFNILMHGDEPEVLDGTELAADWTFSGLQKFGGGLEDRLRGYKLPNKLLEKVNIVEIPGILEVRKQVSRLFPFNDACQWFIDRADIIFLVYDPSKLDVGPETEAILDQLKGREYQTKIILNKADQVKPEELLRVQSALIWNISPLMSSAQPPVMYTASLWSHPYENGAPVRLLQAQERALLRDIRNAIDKRIDNKIASARRFAVRVRNHAKMVDCYLTTFYNHKTLFGNKKQIADQIIDNPQNYHIYEGLSTLTNISRYDLPDPEVYRDFFRLNNLYEFKKLSETCTYFRGCPINKLDIAIAYDLPELVGKYKKLFETALTSLDKGANGKS